LRLNRFVTLERLDGGPIFLFRPPSVSIAWMRNASARRFCPLHVASTALAGLGVDGAPEIGGDLGEFIQFESR
jgi:hypothetical protein